MIVLIDYQFFSSGARHDKFICIHPRKTVIVTAKGLPFDNLPIVSKR